MWFYCQFSRNVIAFCNDKKKSSSFFLIIVSFRQKILQTLIGKQITVNAIEIKFFLLNVISRFKGTRCEDLMVSLSICSFYGFYYNKI